MGNLIFCCITLKWTQTNLNAHIWCKDTWNGQGIWFTPLSFSHWVWITQSYKLSKFTTKHKLKCKSNLKQLTHYTEYKPVVQVELNKNIFKLLSNYIFIYFSNHISEANMLSKYVKQIFQKQKILEANMFYIFIWSKN